MYSQIFLNLSNRNLIIRPARCLSIPIFILATVLFAAWIPFDGHTQPAGLQIGDRVRIILPSNQTKSQRIIGNITGLYATTVEIKTKQSYELIPLESIRRLYVSKGQKRNVRKGLIIGAGVGALAGGIVGASTYKECNNEELFGCFMQPVSREGAIVVGSILGIMGGSVTGSLIGLIKTDKWKRVPVNVSLGLIPNRFKPSSSKPGLSIKFSLNSK